MPRQPGVPQLHSVAMLDPGTTAALWWRWWPCPLLLGLPRLPDIRNGHRAWTVTEIAAQLDTGPAM